MGQGASRDKYDSFGSSYNYGPESPVRTPSRGNEPTVPDQSRLDASQIREGQPRNIFENHPIPVTITQPGAATSEQSEYVPTVFHWGHGGKQVYVTGAFNNWQEKLPLHRSGGDFTTILSLPPGHYQFKFIVDNEWRHCPNMNVARDQMGNVNNFLDVMTLSNYKTVNSEDMLFQEPSTDEPGSPRSSYSCAIPAREEYTKDPPMLPPQLHAVLLNTPPPVQADAATLPVPQHVAINHVYCATRLIDGVVAFGVTHRFKHKYVTTVFYKAAGTPVH
eukprot:TRINITY_DN15098_c0_g1::TRINITY_DN15098_c0_g1_i1::g.24927::m.24927 TRINITY_DN15098_c0_g1::TRINITY_DN15098_c0_g1_i1::g.24927  ORF type:complete len:276 (-),score=21.32,sp/Q9SCY5/KINB2_ARATH/38.10/5e-47,AMPKBI/PF04739.10/1.9e-21 TRINITY_DN15098_c0_g1_i1:1151-1978(-)